MLKGVHVPGPVTPASEVLQSVRVERTLLQDFRPMVESLEWELSSAYWSIQGLQPFLEGVVPYVINNSGWAAQNAAAVLFARCCEAKRLPAEIRILEVGAGLGLFARQLLDDFRRLCSERKRDFYDRLVYHVTDNSARTLEQWRAQDLFAGHGSHVVMARCDALNPLALTTADGQSVSLSGVLAVFANYLLDSLPAAVVRRNGSQGEQLHIRTYFGVQFESERRRHPDLTPERVRALAASDRAEERGLLLPVLPCLEFEASFLPGGVESLPHLGEVLPAGETTARSILSYGAIRFLEECLGGLHPEGFVLLSDYGPTAPDLVEDMACACRFGSSTALAVNFPHLERHFESSGYRFFKPAGDDAPSIHSRLLARGEIPATSREFLERYGDDRYLRSDRLSTTAIAHVNAGRYAEALDCYRTALAQCPRDWHLLGQAAQFLNQQLLHHREALELARAALAINPGFSSFLWNTLGNCLFCLGERDRAHEAYLRALAIITDDPQTHLNLAYTYAEFGDYGEALTSIARGLEHDAAGRFTPSLLQKQQQVMTLIAEHRTALERRLTRRDAVFTTAR